MVITEPWFHKLNQTADVDNFIYEGLDLSWLKKYITSDVYCLMNIGYHVDNCPTVPNGKDLYIFSWFFELFNDYWFLKIYNANPQAQFIILTDMNPNDFMHLPRVKVFKFDHKTTWLAATKQQNVRPTDTDLKNRRYKLSSLVARVSEFKYYITAKLLDINSTDAWISWNLRYPIRESDSYLFEPSGFYHADLLLKHAEFLKTNTINYEKFDPAPLAVSSFNHPAYTDSIINSVNETQNISRTPEFGNLPTPFITEKTWKPLFAGNALLFSGQAGLKQALEAYGLKFDYVWAANYDGDFNDRQRLETILCNIDWIMNTPGALLAEMAEESVQHNLDLVWSDQIEKQIKEINIIGSTELENFLR